MEPLTLFIICCVLAVVAAVLYSFVSAAIYKTEQANKNPYYFCDGDYICCSSGNTACDATPPKGEVPKTDITTTYFPSDRYAYGSAYYQYCVLPVQNAVLNYNNKATTNFNFSYLYKGGAEPVGNPSVYYPGCTANGKYYSDNNITDKPECLDKKLNPWLQPVPGSCPYVSYDSSNGTSYQNNDTQYPVGSTASNASSSITLNANNWTGQSNTNYVANASGNNYSCPYKGIANANAITYISPTQSLARLNALGTIPN